MRDDFGCVNFAGGEVGHLVAFRKPSLEKEHTLLTCCVFRLRDKSKRSTTVSMLELPFPKLFHGSSTSQWQGQWLSWPSLRAHCAHPFVFDEVRSTSVSIHTCCCCLSVGARYFSVFPLAVVSCLALRMQSGKLVSEFLCSGIHPTSLPAALSLTSRCEMTAWGLPDVNYLARTLHWC